MVESEGFLGRWSRLKQEARTGEAEPAAPCPVADDEPAPVAEADVTPVADPVEPPALPPLESLGADSDYTGFLAPGVPKALTVAALRKAWCSDPAIAGFRGFAEYDWDCNAPGYGQLLPTDDIAKLVNDFFRSEPVLPAEMEETPPTVRVDEEVPIAEAPPADTQADGEEGIASDDPDVNPAQA